MVTAWCIWGSAFFALGWLFVELPLIALGELVRRVPFLILILAGGLGGTLVMALPTVVFGFYMSPRVHWKYSFDDLKGMEDNCPTFRREGWSYEKFRDEWADFGVSTLC